MAADYDVVLSFAGEDRQYVERVAAALVTRGIRVFYDVYEEVELWGKDLYQHLSDVYRNRAKYCVIFASKPYAEKLWPRHELASAQARAFGENREYILPARFDDTEIPGILPTTGYLDLRKRTPEDLAAAIERKIRPRISPPHPAPRLEARRSEPAREPVQRFRRREGEPARPWNDPSVPDHEKLARGTVTNITAQLNTTGVLEVVVGDADILQIDHAGVSYYFQCGFTYPNVAGYFYWDGSDKVQGVGHPDGSRWADSDFQVGFFTLEHGAHKGDTARIRITKEFQKMAGTVNSIFHQK